MDEREERTYGSEGEFEADRRRMRERGWVVRRRTDDEAGGVAAWLPSLPLDVGCGDSAAGLVFGIVLIVAITVVAAVVGHRRRGRVQVTYERMDS